MFHRVLPQRDPAWEETEPAWAFSQEAFAECLVFFRKHYHVISTSDLIETSLGRRELPPRALLITFDDGWADNAEYALPLLKAEGLPAVVFVVAGAVGGEEFWPETIVRAWRKQKLNDADYRHLWLASAVDGRPAPESWQDAKSVWSLIQRLQALDAECRNSVLEPVRAKIGRPVRRQMMSIGELRELNASGITVGSHGFTHTPIPYAPDPQSELASSRAALIRALGSESAASIQMFSFPHGIYDSGAIAAAKQAGYEFLFTSDKNLNLVRGDKPSHLLGRINMDSRELTSASGELKHELLALWLFDRTSRYLE